MAKTTWRTKAMYIVFALALVLGLSLTVAMPTQQVALADIAQGGIFAINGGNITLTADGNISGYFSGTSTGIRTGPYYTEVTFGIDTGGTTAPEYAGSFWAKAWVTDNTGSADRIDFMGQYSSGNGTIGTVLTVGSGTLTMDQLGKISVVALPAGDWDISMSGYIGIPEIMPSIALDVKGSIQKFILVNVPLFAQNATSGNYTDHAGLMEQNFKVFDETGNLQDELTWVQTLRNDPEIVGWSYQLGVQLNQQNVAVRGGGNPGDPFIELYSRAPGDLAVFAIMNWVGQNGVEKVITLPSAEKKWGVIDHTILDLSPETPETPQSPQVIWSDAAGTVKAPTYESFSDFVYAWFFWGEGVPTPIHVDTAGHAIVHWWLIKNDDAGVNKAAIEAIMANIGECPTGEELPCGCGRYAPAPAQSPLQQINTIWAKTVNGVFVNKAQFTKFTNNEDGFYYLEKSTDGSYIKTVTQGDYPGETRGLTMVDTANTGGESILIVTLSEYPDEYNGENPVCIELGQKSYGAPPPPQHVKTPQLAWAGQKVVLEQDWSDIIAGNTTNSYVAVYNLEQQSIGELSAADLNSGSAYTDSNGDVWTYVNSNNPISQAILESEVQGEADINVKLYEYGGSLASVDSLAAMPLTTGSPLINYGFLVYYMAFEDVKVANDVTPLAGMSNVNANTDVNLAVQVRGWFKSDELPGTSRLAVDSNGDGLYELPAGRYVMPDDWAALAGNYALRPNWDLMDMGPNDSITSTKTSSVPYLASGVLGPFDGVPGNDVVTPSTPGQAAPPVIGPFSTLQRWSTELMWIAEAATVPTSLPGASHRDTVVPDGKLTWYDAPMPQGLVIFNITQANASPPSLPALSALLKGNLVGYGINSAGTKFQSPFYAAEVPSSLVIPANDYDWNSWGAGAKSGPYPFWTDLLKKSVGDNEPAVTNTQDVEVYCDNHGIAAMTVKGIDSGAVTVQATADYPAAFKTGKYAPVASDEITIHWGYIEQNPHFVADKTVVQVEELVTFTNLSVCGSCPYNKAEWDFNNDGVFEVTISGTQAQVMVPVTWAYTTPGVYTVKLQMTDMATTRFEVRDNYIIVGTPPPVVETWDMPWGTDVDPATFNLWQYPTKDIHVTLADVEDSMPSQLVTLWYYGGPGVGWKFFKPGWGGLNTLTELVPGNYYYGIVSHATSWGIPQS